MFSQRIETIILVTMDSVARVDLRVGRSVEVVNSARVPRPDFADLGGAVRTGLRLEGAKLGKVYVLTDEFWSGRVSLDSGIAEAITEDELEQALALQAEHDSGISPFQSRLGCVRLLSTGERSQWWVTQAELDQLESVSAALRGSAGELVAASSLAAPPPSADASDPDLLDATSPRSCEAFAQVWLERYLADRREVAVISMSQQPRTRLQQRIGAIAAVAVFVVCFGLYCGGASRLAVAQVGLSELAALEKQLRAEVNESEADIRRLREMQQRRNAAERTRIDQLAELQRKRAERMAARKRPTELLYALAATADPGHWIQGIKLSGGQAEISGLAFDNDSVTTLAQQLEAELDSANWRVGVAEISALPSTRLIQFKMTLAPLARGVYPLSIADRGASDAR